MFVTGNPTTVILYVKHYNASFCSNSYIYLRVLTIRFLNVQVVEYGFGVDICF